MRTGTGSSTSSGSRSSRFVVGVTIVALLLTTTPAASWPLLNGLLRPILDPILELLDPVLGTGGILDVEVPLDAAVGDLVDEVVDGLSGTVTSVVTPTSTDDAPIGPGLPGLEGLQGLEVLDGVIEDVLVPLVVAPTADAVAPVIESLSDGLEVLGPVVNDVLDAVYLTLAELAVAADLDAAAYRAVVTTPDGTITRDGVVDVPTLLDVTGDGVQDLSLEVRVITARPSLRVTRLPGAPSDLPVKVEAVIAPGGRGDPDRLAVGFDALGTTLPDTVRATLVEAGNDALAVDLHAVGAGPTLAVVGGAFTTGPDGPIDPTEVAVAFTPVPADVTAAVTGLAGDALGVSLTTSVPTLVDAAIRTVEGTTTTELGASIDRVPGQLDVAVTQAGEAIGVDYAANGPVDAVTLRQAVTEPSRSRSVALGLEGITAESASLTIDPDDLLGFTSSAPVEALSLEVTDTDGIVDRATALRARLAGLPADLAIDLRDDALSLDALGGTLGLLEVQLTSGPDLMPDGDGVVLRDTADAFLVAARVTDLRSITASLTGLADDAVAVTLATVGGRPFSIDAVTGDTTVGALVDALPPTVTIALAGDTLTWEADAVTPRLEVEVVDPDGIIERATSLQAAIEEVPRELTLTTDDAGSSLVASAPIGLLELLATSGPQLSLVEDGLVLRDTPDAYALAARLSGLEAVDLATDPATLTLTTDGPRKVTIDVETRDTDGSGTELLAVLDELPPVAAVSLADLPGELTFEGSDAIGSVVASLREDRVDGTRRTTTLDVTDLPASIALQVGEDALGYTAGAGITALALDIEDTAGIAGRADRLAMRASDLPSALSVELADEAPRLDVPEGAIGEVELLLTDGEELTVAEGIDGVLLRDTPDAFVIAARLTGLRGITLAPDGSALTLRTLGGRTFTLDALLEDVDGTSTAVLATLEDLPSSVTLSLSDPGDRLAITYAASSVLTRLDAELVSSTPGEPPVTVRVAAVDVPTALTLGVDEDGTVGYAADGNLTQLDVELEDPAGVFGGATSARLHLLGLPTGLTLAFGDDGAQLTTSGGAVDLLEVLITSGPEVGLAPGVEGLRLRDVDDELVLAARVTGLSALAFVLDDGGAQLAMDTAGGASFVVDTLVEDSVEGTSTAIGALLEPLPSSVSLQLDESEEGDRELTYTASAPMDRLLADLVLSDPDGTSTFTLEALDLPDALTLDLASSGAIGYVGSAGLGRLAVTASDPDGIFAAATTLEAVLEDLPSAATIELGDDGSVVLDAHGGTLGSLEALATSSPDVEVGLDDGVDGIVLVDEPGRFGTYLRINELRGVALRTSPIELTLDTAAGAVFVVDATLREGGALGGELGDVEVRAALETLPDVVTIGLAPDGDLQELSIDASDRIALIALSLVQADGEGGSPLLADVLIEDAARQLTLGIDAGGTVAYTASQLVPLVAVDAFDADGLFDRADELRLRLEQLPIALDVGLSDTGAIDLNAHGGRLGLIEAQATTGPDRRIDEANDGLLLEDLADRFVVFARFTDLDRASVSQSPLPKVDLLAGGGRPLEIGLFTAAPGKPSPITGQEFTTALLTPAPPQVDLELLPGEPGQLNVAYAASTLADSLVFETNAGDRWLTSASISNPVPTQFTACQAGDRSCVGQTGDADVGSLRFTASQRTTLDVFDCARPLNSNCRRGGSPSQFIDIRQLRLETLGFTGSARQTGFLGCCVSGDLFFDTNNTELVGSLVYRESSDREFTLTFQPGFRANDRQSNFSNVIGGNTGGSVSTSGTITCNPFSFNIRVRVLGINLNLSAKRLIGC